MCAREVSHFIDGHIAFTYHLVDQLLLQLETNLF